MKIKGRLSVDYFQKLNLTLVCAFSTEVDDETYYDLIYTLYEDSELTFREVAHAVSVFFVLDYGKVLHDTFYCASPEYSLDAKNVDSLREKLNLCSIKLEFDWKRLF